MIFLTTVTNAVKELLNGKKIRTITATLFGPGDVKSAPETGPAGYDGSPIPGLTAVFAKTAKRGSTVFIGYVPTNQLALPGEARVYSTDTDGVEKAKIWLHSNGDVEIGGTSDVVNTNHATQFEQTALALSNYFAALNTQIGLGVVSAGGTYTPPVAFDMSAAKLTKILVE
jgi:hypothetical protein